MTVAKSYAESVLEARELCKNLFAKMEKGEAVDFEVLRGLPGLRLEGDSTSWDEIVKIVEDGSEEALGTLGRTPLEVKRYFDNRKVVAAQYASVTDYLLITIFGLPPILGQDGRKAAAVPLDFFEGPLRVVWFDNEFPYYYEEGIEHHNVWANRPLSPEELEEVVAENRQGKQYIYYTNPPALQSVPTVWHAHVISRPLSS